MVLRKTFSALANQPQLQTAAQKYGLQLGAQHIVGGTNISEAIERVQALNAYEIDASLNYLGEFVTSEQQAVEAKDAICAVIDHIVKADAQAHISVKLTQLGLLLDVDFCYDNVRNIVEHAATQNVFVTIDAENANTLAITLDIVEELQKVFDNVGTVVQAYLHEAPAIVERFEHSRLRIVKGAYNESEAVALKEPLHIDIQYVELVEYHLLNGTFTSIATHDDNIIEHVKRFVAEHDIPKDTFEFQMLYGFRKELQQQLAREGYNVCAYVPFGEDWYGYYMRRLAERPKNVSLVTKQLFTKKTNTALAIAAGAFLLGRLTKKK